MTSADGLFWKISNAKLITIMFYLPNIPKLIFVDYMIVKIITFLNSISFSKASTKKMTPNTKSNS